MAEMNLDVGLKHLKKGTSILDINVPEQLKIRIPSGIDFIDDALGGWSNATGFTPSTSMMLTGGPGFGKTTLLLQIADGLTKNGHVVIVNTGEESPYQVRMVTERLKIKHGFIIGNDKKVQDLIMHAEVMQELHPGKQVFIFQDSLQTLDDGHYSNGTTGNTPVRCCELLTDWAKRTFGIVCFIGQVNKAGQFAGKNALKHAIDVHAHFSFDDSPKSSTYGERLFEMQKNRFGANEKTYLVGLDSTGLYSKGHFFKNPDAAAKALIEGAT